MMAATVDSFKKSFDPSQTHPYNPKKSTSFQRAPGVFALSYADSTSLQGFICRDIVQLGDYWVETRFGCITNCNSPDFNGDDGIVGFGLPTPSQNPQQPLPAPLLFELTDSRKSKNPKNKMLNERIFAFLSTEQAGELQLGGVDPESTAGEMAFTPTMTPHDFSVPVFSVKYGHKELLDFVPTNPGLRYVPGIVDSGSSCLVLPDTLLQGLLKIRPYSTYKEMRKTHPKASFLLSLSGIPIEIPWKTWYLAKANKACVQKTPPMFPGVLIGDVLFRRYVVLFNMTDPMMPILGIAPQKPGYVAAKKAHMTNVHKMPVGRRPSNVTSEEGGRVPPSHLARRIDNIPVINKKETQYFIKIQIGSPRKWHTVTFDTGSSVFGIFSKSPPHYDAGSMFDHTGGLLASKVTIIAIGFVVVVIMIAAFFVIKMATSSTRDVKVGSSEEKRNLL